MKCPNCGLINPPEAQRCDCGFDFEAGAMRKSYLRPSESRDEHSSGRWGYVWLLLLCLPQMVHGIQQGSTGEVGLWIAAGIVLLCAHLFSGSNPAPQNDLVSLRLGDDEGSTVDPEPDHKRVPVDPPEPNSADRFFNEPNPEMATNALRSFASHPACQEPGNNVTWYLFARIAQDHRNLLREYEALFRDLREGRRVVLRVLAQAGDNQTKTFLEHCVEDVRFAEVQDQIAEVLQGWSPGSIAPISRIVSTPADLDLLWCEFRATKDLAAVSRIIDVLERPDHVGGKLEAWLNAVPRRGLSVVATIARKLLARKLWKSASILCDIEGRKVLSPQDLDCQILMTGWNIDQERARKVAKLIPGGLFGEDSYLLLKAAARWSLASHAFQYPSILELCEDESRKRAGRCRILLLEITAAAALNCADLQRAFNVLHESLTPDPEMERCQSDKAEKDWELLQVLTAHNAVLSIPHRESENIIQECLRVTAAADTYRSRLISANDPDKGPPGPGDAVWDCQFARPANFRVFQTTWWESEQKGDDPNTKEALFDEWITAAGTEFHGPGYMAFPNRSRSAITRSLRVSTYFNLLKDRRPTTLGTCFHEGSRYFCFEYRKVAPPSAPWWSKLASRIAFPSRRCDVMMWVDCDTKYLRKVSLRFARTPSGQRQELTHLFSSYNEPVSIVPPAFSLMEPPTPKWKTYLLRLLRRRI